jgi:hypothetical protein
MVQVAAHTPVVLAWKVGFIGRRSERFTTSFKGARSRHSTTLASLTGSRAT